LHTLQPMILAGIYYFYYRCKAGAWYMAIPLVFIGLLLVYQIMSYLRRASAAVEPETKAEPDTSSPASKRSLGVSAAGLAVSVTPIEEYVAGSSDGMVAAETTQFTVDSSVLNGEMKLNSDVKSVEVLSSDDQKDDDGNHIRHAVPVSEQQSDLKLRGGRGVEYDDSEVKTEMARLSNTNDRKDSDFAEDYNNPSMNDGKGFGNFDLEEETAWLDAHVLQICSNWMDSDSAEAGNSSSDLR
jgi:uncharacterized membrane protein